MDVSTTIVTKESIPDGEIPRTKLTSVGHQVSSSSGSYSTTSSTLVDVTNLTVSITTTGRPVVVMLISDGGSSYIAPVKNTEESGVVIFNIRAVILRGSTTISDVALGFNIQATDVSFPGAIANLPPGIVNHLDTPSAGTYTYKIQASAPPNTSAHFRNCKLVAYEL